MVALTSIIIAGILAIQTPQVQTYLAQKILKNVSVGPDARIAIGKIHIRPFNTLILKDVSVIDKAPADSTARDTLFSAEYIIARVSLRGLGEKEGLHIGRAYIRGAELNMVIEESQTNLERMFGIRKDRVKKDSQGNVFDIRRAFISGMRFRMQNFRKDFPERPAGTIDWGDLDISDINVEARNIKLADKSMSGTVDILSFKEKSGYVCKAISGTASVGHGISRITDLVLEDSWSSVDIPQFSMSYKTAKDFKDFENRIGLDIDMRESSLGLKTLSYFVPSLAGMPFTLDIPAASVSGTVSDLKVSGLDAGLASEDIYLSLGGHIKGLPDMQALTTDLKVDSLSFTTASVQKLLEEISSGKAPQISGYAQGSRFNFKGIMKGSLDSLHVAGALGSGLGMIVPGLTITGLMDKSRDTEIKGRLRTWNLDIGKAIGSDLVHQCSLDASLKAAFGQNGPRLEIDSLVISRLNVKDYDYSGIAAKGTLAQESFDGKIICSDPNLNFLFQGIFNVSSKTSNALYRFYANIGYADLQALNLDRRGKSRVSLQTKADFYRIKGRDMLGKIDVNDINLENSSGEYRIGDISISSHSSDTIYRMKLDSDFAEGSFIGDGSISTFIKDMKDLVLRKQFPAMYNDSTYVWNRNSYDFSLKLYDTMDLLAFAAPGLYIAEGTSLDIHINDSGMIDGLLESQRLAYREQFMKDLTMDFSNDANGLKAKLSSETINVAALSLKNNTIRIFAKDNHLGTGFTFDNQADQANRGEFYLLADLVRNQDDKLQYNLSLLPSSMYINDKEWNIMSSQMAICGNEIDVESIEFTSGEQALRIHGGITDSGRDTLCMDAERFDLSVLNPLLGGKTDFGGAVTGNVHLMSDGKDKSLSVDLLSDSTEISGTGMGTVRLGGSWNSGTGMLEARLNNSLDGKSTFDISGSLDSKAKDIDMEAVLDRFDISCLGPYLSSIFSETAGTVSGTFTAGGKLSGMDIESTGARFDNAMMRIAFTNVPYTVNGGFRIDSRGVYFDGISLADRYGNPGQVTGEITYDNFKDIRLNAHIDATRIECIDLDENMNESFYGNIFATAGISITGPLNSLKMAVDATTTGRGELHVPISSAKAGTSDLLTFKKADIDEVYIDPYEAMISRMQKKEKTRGNFSIDLMVAATPGLQAFVEIDKASGNVLSGFGSGTIDLDINPSQDVFNINGDYTLSGGNYRFVAIGLAKDFSIDEGSSIKFNGDIMASILDIDATYTTKTSLSTLIADTSSVSSRRTVECGIHISDRISNPRLQFSINVPDIDPTIKARVESALNTEDKVQKQFLSLLMSNSFLPDEQSGIVNNTSFLTSSVSEIMSNQLNTIFQKLDIPLDLGLNYQANDKGNDIFDVAVSTQLFNNRVVVNGNIGNRQYNSGSTNSDVVGDLDIEIKIDRPGAFRLNLFSHSADQYTNYLDNSQRNGIGITYQQEFNSFKEFFRKLFSGKKRKEAIQRREEKALLDEEKVTIKIKKDNGNNK